MSTPGENEALKVASKLESNISGRRIFFRFLKGMAVGIPVVMVLGIVGFYAYENHIGEKAWLETKAKYEQQGLSFDLANFVPEMPPEEENFARCKVIRSLTTFTQSPNGDHQFDDPVTRDAFLEMKAPKRQGNPGGSFEYGLPIDFEVWITSFQESEPWNPAGVSETWTLEKMRNELSAFDSQIFALNAESTKRQFNQLILEFGDSYFSHSALSSPHLSNLREFCYFLKLRANLAVHDSDSELALACIQLMLRIADTVESDPNLISNLIAITIRWSAAAAVWDGLENRAWNLEQLETLQADLQEPLCITSMADALQIDAIVSFSRGVSDFLNRPDQMKSLGEIQIMDGSLHLGEYSHWFPTGWWNQNRVIAITEIYENVVLPAQAGDHEKLVNCPHFYPLDAPYSHTFYYSLHASGYEGIVQRNLEIQTKINLAITACAIEQFQLKNNRLPDSISELKAANLGEIRDDFHNPEGGPLQYRKDSDNGRYLLYSYGTNQKDNGGKANSKGGRSPFDQVDKEISDIVWRYSSPKILKLKALFDSGKWMPAP